MSKVDNFTSCRQLKLNRSRELYKQQYKYNQASMKLSLYNA